MSANSTILAWRIPWTEEPGKLQSMGLQKVLNTTEVTQHACMSLCYSETVNVSVTEGRKDVLFTFLSLASGPGPGILKHLRELGIQQIIQNKYALFAHNRRGDKKKNLLRL